jgi:flagellar biosynthesis/type III secretory pathway protein FliH
MSDAPIRTRISGGFSLVSSDGAQVVVSDGAGNAPALQKDPRGAMLAAEIEKAKQAGRKQGFDECLKKTSGDLAALNAQLDEARRQIPEALNAYLSDLEIQMREEIVAIAFKAAEAIVGAELERRDVTAEAVRAAISPLLTTNGVKVHVSPSFLAKGACNPPAGASFVADPKLKTGEIMVDSQQGMIDGTILSRLETLKETLLKSMTKESADV